MIQIESITVGMFQSNCYVVSCADTRHAVVIDAGDEAPRILDLVESMAVEVKAVINTHAHLDHVSGLVGVVEALGIPVWMHPAEKSTYDGLEAQAAMFGLTAPERVAIDRWIEDGEVFTVGNVRATVILAPGHSPGSVCIAFWDESPPRLVCGDVLFKGSIGRTDLPGGDYATIMETLSSRFVPMPDDTVVYSGHGPATTIGDEKRSNPFLAPLVR